MNYNDEEGSETVPLSFYYKIGNFHNFCRFSVVVSMIDSVNCIRNFVRVISARKRELSRFSRQLSFSPIFGRYSALFSAPLIRIVSGSGAHWEMNIYPNSLLPIRTPQSPGNASPHQSYILRLCSQSPYSCLLLMRLEICQ